MTGNTEYLNIRDAIDFLKPFNINVRTFQNWCKVGHVDSVKDANGKYLILKSDLEEYKAYMVKEFSHLLDIGGDNVQN
jgi:predicted site-specific integrase-resolvase